MSVDTANEFVKQNGAFGVLVVLIGLFVWKGIPYIVRRLEKRDEEQAHQIKVIVDAHKAGMDAVVETLKGIRSDLLAMNARISHLEDAVRGRRD